jgi:hypothetical protein
MAKSRTQITQEIKPEVIEKEKPKIELSKFINQNGALKYYLKHNPLNNPKIKTRNQIEKDGKIIYEDDLTECPYYENLTLGEIEEKRKLGYIF